MYDISSDTWSVINCCDYDTATATNNPVIKPSEKYEMCSLGDYIYSFDTTSVMRINASALLRGEQAFWHDQVKIRSEVTKPQKILRAQKIN